MAEYDPHCGYKRRFHNSGSKWGHTGALEQNLRVAKYKIYMEICDTLKRVLNELRHFYGKIDSGELGDEDDFLIGMQQKEDLMSGIKN